MVRTNGYLNYTMPERKKESKTDIFKVIRNNYRMNTFVLDSRARRFRYAMAYAMPPTKVVYDMGTGVQARTSNEIVTHRPINQWKINYDRNLKNKRRGYFTPYFLMMDTVGHITQDPVELLIDTLQESLPPQFKRTYKRNNPLFDNRTDMLWKCMAIRKTLSSIDKLPEIFPRWIMNHNNTLIKELNKDLKETSSRVKKCKVTCVYESDVKSIKDETQLKQKNKHIKTVAQMVTRIMNLDEEETITIETTGVSNINKNENKASIVKMYRETPFEGNKSQKFDPKLAWKKIAQIYKGLRKYNQSMTLFQNKLQFILKLIFALLNIKAKSLRSNNVIPRHIIREFNTEPSNAKIKAWLSKNNEPLEKRMIKKNLAILPSLNKSPTSQNHLYQDVRLDVDNSTKSLKDLQNSVICKTACAMNHIKCGQMAAQKVEKPFIAQSIGSHSFEINSSMSNDCKLKKNTPSKSEIVHPLPQIQHHRTSTYGKPPRNFNILDSSMESQMCLASNTMHNSYKSMDTMSVKFKLDCSSNVDVTSLKSNSNSRHGILSGKDTRKSRVMHANRTMRDKNVVETWEDLIKINTTEEGKHTKIKKPWNIKLFGDGENEDKEAEIALTQQKKNAALNAVKVAMEPPIVESTSSLRIAQSFENEVFEPAIDQIMNSLNTIKKEGRQFDLMKKRKNLENNEHLIVKNTDRLNQYRKKTETLAKLPMLKEKYMPELKHISNQARMEQVKDVELASWLVSLYEEYDLQKFTTSQFRRKHVQLMLEKLKLFTKLEFDKVEYLKEKLCLLSFSFPANDVATPQFQLAVKFILSKLLNEESWQIDDWLLTRGLPLYHMVRIAIPSLPTKESRKTRTNILEADINKLDSLSHLQNGKKNNK